MLDALREGWLALQTWWQELTPGSQAFLHGAAVLLGAFLAGLLVGRKICRRLGDGGFDSSLRPPWLPPDGGLWAETRPFTPSGVVGGLVCGTVWGAAVWWLATEHRWTPFAGTLAWAGGRLWSLAAVLVVALYLARFLAGQVIELLQSPPVGEKLDGWLARAGGDNEPRAWGVPALAGMVVYGVVLLLVLLVAADLFGWALTGGVVAGVWYLLIHAATAGAAMLIGWLGYRWARGLTFAEGESAPAQAAHYAAVAIAAGTTLLAIALLAATLQGLVGVAFMLLLGFVLWPLRGYVPDLWAGVLLKGQKVEQVRLDGELTKVGEVGLLTTRLQRQDEQLTRRNKVVLDAHLQGGSKAGSGAP